MIENGHNIQTIYTRRTGLQAGHFLQLEQVKEKKGKANPLQNPLSTFFFNAPFYNKCILTSNVILICYNEKK
jgi:hypothetical protein